MLKVVEVPPGPPVLATLLAEIYGPNEATRLAVAEEVKKLFRKVPYIVDVDDSYGHREAAAHLRSTRTGWSSSASRQSDVYDTIQDAVRRRAGRLLVPRRGPPADRRSWSACRMRDLSWNQQLAATPVPANTVPGSKTVVELGEVVRVDPDLGSRVLFRRDGHFADMVTGELAGEFEAPIYGMLAVDKRSRDHDWGKLPRPDDQLPRPADQTKRTPTLLWDGEWEITYVTFRDMGAAFDVAMLGHLHPGRGAVRQLQAAAGDPDADPADADRHRAGALAVRRAVHRHLDDRLHRAGRDHRAQLDPAGGLHPPRRRGRGMTLREVLLEAGAIRFRPILLTALSAMIGAATILTDPIFQGLAISLLFGLASSTLLTVLVIPAIYVVLRDADRVVS